MDWLGNENFLSDVEWRAVYRSIESKPPLGLWVPLGNGARNRFKEFGLSGYCGKFRNVKGKRFRLNVEINKNPRDYGSDDSS